MKYFFVSFILYLTWEHHALGVILCLCLNFFELSTAELFFQSQRSLKNQGFKFFLSMKVRIPSTPGEIVFLNLILFAGPLFAQETMQLHHRTQLKRQDVQKLPAHLDIFTIAKNAVALRLRTTVLSYLSNTVGRLRFH